MAGFPLRDTGTAQPPPTRFTLARRQWRRYNADIMPTPFTHLETAQRLLQDPLLPAQVRTGLAQERGAFLLGSVAPDARMDGLTRDDTHFYAYTSAITRPPWRVMLDEFPVLIPPHSAAHRAFLAGYAAHLAVDVVWTVEMLGPHFATGSWGESRPFRFLMLHVLLIHMDERDLAALQPWQPATLAKAQPDSWLPFLTDTVLADWRDFIYQQIKADGESQTLAVFGARINKTPDDLRAILDSPQQMQAGLWDNIPRETLAEIEARMYASARVEMTHYWDESEP
ncbi:MAG: zinc dependent phospholipase C family protein [Anaerolineaceae bacterium]|nr:zinc dependent phospholipase C family protein [Anaerolineaceae bacterium]